MTLSCFDPEDLARSRERYLQEQARNRPKTKTEILLEVVAEFPDASVRELADASGMGTTWVRKHLRDAVQGAPHVGTKS